MRATALRKHSETALERKIAHFVMLLCITDEQIQYLRSTTKTISLREFKVLQEEKAALTQAIKLARIELDAKPYAQSSATYRPRLRPVLRLIRGGKQ